MTSYEPDELVRLEREENEARLRLDAARARNLMDEGEAPTADHALIEKLEEEWKHAVERLKQGPGGAKD